MLIFGFIVVSEVMGRIIRVEYGDLVGFRKIKGDGSIWGDEKEGLERRDFWSGFCRGWSRFYGKGFFGIMEKCFEFFFGVVVYLWLVVSWFYFENRLYLDIFVDILGETLRLYISMVRF